MAKNSKKSFSDNLSNIFEYTLNEDNKQDNPTFLSKSEEFFEKKEDTVLDDGNVKEKKNTRKTPRKSFSEGLESFFKESIEEAIGDSATVTEVKKGVVKKGKKRAIGIEVLLQRTLFKEYEDQFHDEKKERYPKTKRITFVLDSEKVDVLKNIARKEKKELRQIISKLIEEYIQDEKSEPSDKKKVRKTSKTTLENKNIKK